VTATNFCDSESDLNLTDAHCTVNATATPIPGQIILTWTPYRGWTQVQQYEIYQVTSYNPLMVNFVDVVPGNTIRYIQPFEDCFNNIAYRIRAVGSTPLQISWSDTTQAVSKRGVKGDPAEMVRATVENNASVLVEWKDVQLPGLAKIFVEKSEDGTNFEGLATLPPGEEKFRDNDVDVQSESYTYRLFAQDSCGNYTPMSNVATSILLSAEKQFNTTLLRWTPYTEWQFGVQHYVIELFVDTTGQYTEIARVDGSVHEYLDRFTTLDQPLYCYRIRAIEMPGGNSAWSLSNEVCVRVESGIHAPNAFTPNEDGINDRFYLQGIHVQTFNLQIFSRWGLLMFETNDISEGWDGFYQGEKAPEGAYVYVARGVGYNGMPYVIKGTLTLMR
jgi:gliding motility-associated-like protein